MDMPFIVPTALASNAVYTLYQNTNPTNNLRSRP